MKLTIVLLMVLVVVSLAFADERSTEHIHVHPVPVPPNVVFVYQCTKKAHQFPRTDTWTDGTNTMYIVRGQCKEA